MSDATIPAWRAALEGTPVVRAERMSKVTVGMDLANCIVSGAALLASAPRRMFCAAGFGGQRIVGSGYPPWLGRTPRDRNEDRAARAAGGNATAGAAIRTSAIGTGTVLTTRE